MSVKQRVEASDTPSHESVTILLPVLNELQRLAGCLETLIAQPREVREILVIDGGSSDGTQALVDGFAMRDGRVRLVDASPVDPEWTGKAWGLHRGLQQSASQSDWILCIDADVRAAPQLVRSLLAHARRTSIDNFSVATLQHLSGWIDGLLHPAMLTTLIYRFGSPGAATRDRHKVHANGQCFFSRRETLLRTGAFYAARRSLCEDITIVRRLAECGEAVGFYESDYLITVKMYAHWRETWNNWPRSLPMRDHYFAGREALGLIALLPLQALPLPTFVLGAFIGAPLWLLLLAGALFSIRLGVLFGTARAYPGRPWSYWLSPLCDLPVVLRVLYNALKRQHRWRGRTYVRRRGGTFEPL
ncbi:MAG: glycosyltransferase family 2 protein [Deltaproteobacteria bacterium]|nr:glycosyltransferase family 2 protein [Deltaproteobacteria bacterium]